MSRYIREKDQNIRYSKTKEGLCARIYASQRRNCKKKDRPYPTYNLEEFKIWMFSQTNFELLYNNWIQSNYKKELKPSADRINNNLSYMLDNIQLVTWDENNNNGYRDMRNGKIIITSNPQKPIVGTHKKTGEVVEFVSASEAGRILNINQKHITTCCTKKESLHQNGKYYVRKSAGGYTWKHKEN